MARNLEWLREVRDELKHEPWAKSGPRSLVKVVIWRDQNNVPLGKVARVAGYVTQPIYLEKRTPREIERLLGLREDELLRGCRIYRLNRLPTRGEYTYDLTADHPDGLAHNPADRDEYITTKHDDAMKARGRAPAAIRDYYPMGASWIPQWKVTASIPVLHLVDLWPGDRFRPSY